MKPGLIVLARIPYFAISVEKDLVSDIIAPLEAAYTESSSKPICPTIDAIFTTEPFIFFFNQKLETVCRIENILKNLHQKHFLFHFFYF